MDTLTHTTQHLGLLFSRRTKSSKNKQKKRLKKQTLHDSAEPFHAFSSLCTPLLCKKPCHFPFSGSFPSVSSKAHNEGRTIHVLARMVPLRKHSRRKYTMVAMPPPSQDASHHQNLLINTVHFRRCLPTFLFHLWLGLGVQASQINKFQ